MGILFGFVYFFYELFYMEYFRGNDGGTSDSNRSRTCHKQIWLDKIDFFNIWYIIYTKSSLIYGSDMVSTMKQVVDKHTVVVQEHFKQDTNNKRKREF